MQEIKLIGLVILLGLELKPRSGLGELSKLMLRVRGMLKLRFHGLVGGHELKSDSLTNQLTRWYLRISTPGDPI